ncbi:hypothetical protein HDU96_001340 [Phlyctochytrium bullatum]|nr:hypothetical protein HDU96_001340 [Phlyctochytrium bullatum]
MSWSFVGFDFERTDCFLVGVGSDMSRNILTGPLPESVYSLRNLEILFLPGNKLRGNISRSVGNLSNLKRLILSDNELYGQIPSEIGGLSNLEAVSLSSNFFRGEVPDFGALRRRGVPVGLNDTCLTFSGTSLTVRSVETCDNFYASIGLGPTTTVFTRTVSTTGSSTSTGSSNVASITPSSVSTASDISAPASSVPIAAIAGGVVAAIVLIAAGIVAFLVIKRRNTSKAAADKSSFTVISSYTPANLQPTPQQGFAPAPFTNQQPFVKQDYPPQPSNVPFYPQQPAPAQLQPYGVAPSVGTSSSYSTPTATSSYGGSAAPQHYPAQNVYPQEQSALFDSVTSHLQTLPPAYGSQHAESPYGGGYPQDSKSQYQKQ